MLIIFSRVFCKPLIYFPICEAINGHHKQLFQSYDIVVAGVFDRHEDFHDFHDLDN